MPDQYTPLVITKAVLKELDEMSVTLKIPKIDKLSYREAQQVLLITSLKNWIEAHGIAAVFEINLD